MARREPAQRTYLCIDLKSFYASVECVMRGLDPLTTNLVVADPTRTEKTICLAVSPSLKALGVSSGARVFEIPKGVDYIMAPPRMKTYIEKSADIYEIYLGYVSKDDIHVYSIDEAWLDVTHYLPYYQTDARSLARTITDDVLARTGISAACGIGPNLYLSKVALDILAKHEPDGIAELDEQTYKTRLWTHEPITDFWRIGPGTERRLARMGITTMGGVALANEDELYDAFGIDAELLIDHAWGIEPTTIADIKAYEPKSTCVTSGQVLGEGRTKADAILLVKEMADQLALKLVDEHLRTRSINVAARLRDAEGRGFVQGTERFAQPTSSDRALMRAAVAVWERVVPDDADVRGIMMSAGTESDEGGTQLDLLGDAEGAERDNALQRAQLDIKRRFGKNSVLKAMDLAEGATTRERNHQLGGHRSGE